MEGKKGREEGKRRRGKREGEGGEKGKGKGREEGKVRRGKREGEGKGRREGKGKQ